MGRARRVYNWLRIYFLLAGLATGSLAFGVYSYYVKPNNFMVLFNIGMSIGFMVLAFFVFIAALVSGVRGRKEKR